MNRKWRPPEDPVVWLFFLGLTLIASAGVWMRGETVLVGIDNDVYINTWADWWSQRAWLEPGLGLWETPYLLYPNGADLTYHSFSPLNTLLSLALRPVVRAVGGPGAGAITAYNLAILANYAFSGLAMYHLARYLTGSRRAAVLAGVVFAFNSHSLYQSSHPVLHSIWCFPWVTLYFLRAARENSVRLALVAALFVALGSLTSTILLFMLIVYCGFLWLFLTLAPAWPRVPWRVLLAFGAASALLSLPASAHLLAAALFGDNTSFLIDPATSITGDLMGPFLPHWVSWLKRGLYFGFVPLVLLILARRAGRLAGLWAWLLALAFLFSIGPQPDFLGIDLDVSLPWSIPLVPVLRNTYRLNILIGLALGALCAHGWTILARRLPARARQPAWAALLALLLVDYLIVPFPFSPTTISPFYGQVLATVPDDVALATVPFGRQVDKRYLFEQTIHGHPITGGVISRAEGDAFAFILDNPLLRSGALTVEPAPLPPGVLAELERLADAGIGFLVVHRQVLAGDRFDDAWDPDAWIRSIPLQPAYADDWLVAYDLRPLAARP